MTTLTKEEVKQVQDEAKKYDCPNCFKLGASFVIGILNKEKPKFLEKKGK